MGLLGQIYQVSWFTHFIMGHIYINILSGKGTTPPQNSLLKPSEFRYHGQWTLKETPAIYPPF